MGTSINLKEATAQYIQHLTDEGQKPSTIGTARRTLDMLIEEMGEQKEVGKILTVHVAAFLKSEAATLLKGKPRAEASVLQIRRIVRAALVWFHQQDWLEVLPLPKDEKRFLKSGERCAVGGEPNKKEQELTALRPDAPSDEAEVADGNQDHTGEPHNGNQ